MTWQYSLKHVPQDMSKKYNLVKKHCFYQQKIEFKKQQGPSFESVCSSVSISTSSLSDSAMNILRSDFGYP